MDNDQPDAGTTHVRGSELTLQSVFAAVIVAAIMGLSYPYMVLKLGFDLGSIPHFNANVVLISCASESPRFGA